MLTLLKKFVNLFIGTSDKTDPIQADASPIPPSKAPSAIFSKSGRRKSFMTLRKNDDFMLETPNHFLYFCNFGKEPIYVKSILGGVYIKFPPKEKFDASKATKPFRNS